MYILPAKFAIRVGLIAFAFTLASCEGGPSLDGTVVNRSTGQPIANATVEIEKTQLSSNTDSKGTYSLKFIPGKFVVRASAPGFLYARVPYEMITGSKVPAKPIKLIPEISMEDINQYLTHALPDFRCRTYYPPGIIKLEKYFEVKSIQTKLLEQTGDSESRATVELVFVMKDNLHPGSDIGLCFGKVTGLRKETGHRFSIRKKGETLSSSVQFRFRWDSAKSKWIIGLTP